ncbi:MAG: NADH-quinone oxidoreductase subunit C [Myxococcaceae bacterium]
MRHGVKVVSDPNPELLRITKPSIPRLVDAERTVELDEAQVSSAEHATDLEVAPAVCVPLEAVPPSLPASNASDLEGVLNELGVVQPAKQGPPLVPIERHLELAGRLKGLGYRQLVSIIATHWLAGKGRGGNDATEVEHYEVVYLLRSIGRGSRVATWAVRQTPGNPVPSLSELYAGADWQEREQFDLVGVVFSGHPDLRRLMMAENYPGHPLRRDFAADTAAAPWR